jgi:hypothetical protein
VVEVVGLDIGDDRDGGVVEQERPVALVSLGDEDVAAAVVGVGARVVEIAADREGRVRTAVLQRDREHRRRGRLAVGAGHRDAAPPDHGGSQRGGPRDHRDSPPDGLDDLRVAGPDRRGDHHGLGVGDVVGPVAEMDGRPERAQRDDLAVLLDVAAGHIDAAREVDARDARHADAADAHEVHPAELLGGHDVVGTGPGGHCSLPSLPPAAARTMATSRSSASGRPKPAAAAPIVSSLP